MLRQSASSSAKQWKDCSLRSYTLLVQVDFLLWFNSNASIPSVGLSLGEVVVKLTRLPVWVGRFDWDTNFRF